MLDGIGDVKNSKRNWKEKYQTVHNEHYRDRRALEAKHKLELEALKAKVFDATAANSPWVRQNMKIRDLVMAWREKKAKPQAVLMSIIKILGAPE